MNRLTDSAQTSIVINGREYVLQTSYKNALMTVFAWYAHECGDLDPDPVKSSYIAADIAISNMLIDEPPFEDRQEAVRLIGEYINKCTRNNDIDDTRPPILDIEQDASYIYDAFQLMGVDLESTEITFPRFMSLLRVLPKDAPLCRIVYLRQQRRDGKLTKEERAEIYRSWGWDVIMLRDRKAKKDAENSQNELLSIRNKARAAKGLPPV